MSLLGNTSFYGAGQGAEPNPGGMQLRGSADLLNRIKGGMMQPRNAMLMQALSRMPNSQTGQSMMGQAVPPMQDMAPAGMGGLPGQLPGSMGMPGPNMQAGLPGMGPSPLDAIPRNLQGQGMGATAPMFSGAPSMPGQMPEGMSSAMPLNIPGQLPAMGLRAQSGAMVNPGEVQNMMAPQLRAQTGAMAEPGEVDNLRKQLFMQFMQSQGGGL